MIVQLVIISYKAETDEKTQKNIKCGSQKEIFTCGTEEPQHNAISKTAHYMVIVSNQRRAAQQIKT